LLGGVVADVVTLRFGKNAEECGIAARDPATERETADEDGHPCQQAIEEVECADSSDANEVKQGPLYA
jgi:hypothetical protein